MDMSRLTVMRRDRSWATISNHDDDEMMMVMKGLTDGWTADAALAMMMMKDLLLQRTPRSVATTLGAHLGCLTAA